MRLIDADKLPLDIEREDVDDAPTIDAVEVVRCRDCKHWNPNGIGICKLHDIRPTPLMMDDWFCADGERKEQNDEN